jgi:hypothetical protein
MAIKLYGTNFVPKTNKVSLAGYLAAPSPGQNPSSTPGAIFDGFDPSSINLLDVFNNPAAPVNANAGASPILQLPRDQVEKLAMPQPLQDVLERNPSYPRPEIEPDFGTVSDYIGYVIQKERILPDGDSEIVDLIAIEGKDSFQFVDTKIAYGETYRYKIRTIFRFVSKPGQLAFEDSDFSITRVQSARYIDVNTIIIPSQTYYFDSAWSLPAEVQTTELVRPNPPYNVKVVPNSYSKKIFVTWNQKTQNRDVAGFNVYRKEKNQPNDLFKKLNDATIDIRNNSFLDFDIFADVEYVYAIESIDFHGNFSKLSAQFCSKIKEFKSDEYVCEMRQKFYETEGLELNERSKIHEQNLFVFKDHFTIHANPLFVSPGGNKFFLLRITSLDTGQKKEIKLNFTDSTIYHASAYVPDRLSQVTIKNAIGFMTAEKLAAVKNLFR